MQEKPILFNAPMVQAILAGRKTQTRRLAKPQPVGQGPYSYHSTWGDFKEVPQYRGVTCPFGQIGDQLWVREAWRVTSAQDDISPSRLPHDLTVEYRATPKEMKLGKWRPSIHMPRWACRIMLEITAIRIERLQDISDKDVLAEGLATLSKDNGKTFKHGIPDNDGLPGDDHYGWPWKEWNADPKMAFRNLWKAGDGGSWDKNPWVWVIEFNQVPETNRA